NPSLTRAVVPAVALTIIESSPTLAEAEDSMSRTTEQMNVWLGEFGNQYTERNALSQADMEALYQRNFGITRTELNTEFLGELDRELRILEVGANVGNQLWCLQRMGFRQLYGIELQTDAVEKAKQRTSGLHIIPGSAYDIPFKDSFFDLVYTSNVLIHL